MPVTVRFDGVGKRFRRGEIHDSLRDLVAACSRRLFGHHKSREKARSEERREGKISPKD